jgi:hypothetical protein
MIAVVVVSLSLASMTAQDIAVPTAASVPVNMMHAEANRPVSWQLPFRLISLDELRAARGTALADALAPLVAELEGGRSSRRLQPRAKRDRRQVAYAAIPTLTLSSPSSCPDIAA